MFMIAINTIQTIILSRQNHGLQKCKKGHEQCLICNYNYTKTKTNAKTCMKNIEPIDKTLKKLANS